jgi:hypothetical protein
MINNGISPNMIHAMLKDAERKGYEKAIDMLCSAKANEKHCTRNSAIRPEEWAEFLEENKIDQLKLAE